MVAGLVGAGVYVFTDVGRPAPASAAAPDSAASQPSSSSDADSATSPSEPGGSPSVEITTSTPDPPTEEQLREAALATLEDMVTADRSRDPVRGQWVAQLASKYEGVVDESQQDEPFTIPDILDEVLIARQSPEYGHLVRVIHQGDWGRSEPGAQTMWVTVVDLDYRSREDVVQWCEDHFSQRGEALLNVCYARELHRR